MTPKLNAVNEMGIEKSVVNVDHTFVVHTESKQSPYISYTRSLNGANLLCLKGFASGF